MSSEYPSYREMANNNNNKNDNKLDDDAGYPDFSDIVDMPGPPSALEKPNEKKLYDKPMEKPKPQAPQNKNNYNNKNQYPQKHNIQNQQNHNRYQNNQYPPQVPLPPQPNQYMPVPNGPMYVPMAYPGMPVYPGPGLYPPGYPMYNPPMPNTVVVIPPGYKPDYTANYSPFGDLMDDLDNLY